MPSSVPRIPFVRRALIPGLAVCLFALIVGAKWATFDRYGSPMPDWDQWDAEATNLLIPWFEDGPFLERLLTPHNEHRVVLTKLQNLALAIASGQWDSRLEAVTNALLHAALAAALWLGARRWAAAGWHAALFALAFALFGLPLAWQNVLGGFHSQQYWLVGLSTAAVATLPFARPWGASWWAGALAAVLACGSMGSGFLAAFVVLLVIGWRAGRAETSWREAWPALVLCLGLVALGLLTRVEVAHHAHMKVKSVHDFVLYLLRSLQWPLRDHEWAGPILWLPWAIAAWRTIAGRTPREGQTIVALGGWTLGQLIATAYARGAGADHPASRYMDTLSFGALVNGLALAWLFSTGGFNRPRRLALGVVGVAWVALLGSGMRENLTRSFEAELPDARKYYDKAEANMANYLATGDRAHLAGRHVPYPNADELIKRLSHPCIRSLMPEPLRTPLGLAPAADSPGFIMNDARKAGPSLAPARGLRAAIPPLPGSVTWGSFAPDLLTTGSWRSEPLDPPRMPWLKFSTAGDLGLPGAAVSLVLREARTGAVLAEVRTDGESSDVWHSAYVPSPRVPFVVEARDESTAHWLAFSEPVEVSRPSYWARQATRYGMLLMQIAGAAAVLLVVAARRWAPTTGR